MIENMLEYSWKTLKHLQSLKSNKFISFMCQVHQIINKLGKLRYLFVTLKKKSRTNEETNKQNNKKQCSKHEYIRKFLICALLGHQLEDDTIFQKCVLCLTGAIVGFVINWYFRDHQSISHTYGQRTVPQNERIVRKRENQTKKFCACPIW